MGYVCKIKMLGPSWIYVTVKNKNKRIKTNRDIYIRFFVTNQNDGNNHENFTILYYYFFLTTTDIIIDWTVIQTLAHQHSFTFAAHIYIYVSKNLNYSACYD